MTRSLLQPIRSLRVARVVPVRRDAADFQHSALSPGTRKTLAAIGALWVSFASSASATLPPSAADAPLEPPASAGDHALGSDTDTVGR